MKSILASAPSVIVDPVAGELDSEYVMTSHFTLPGYVFALLCPLDNPSLMLSSRILSITTRLTQMESPGAPGYMASNCRICLIALETPSTYAGVRRLVQRLWEALLRLAVARILQRNLTVVQRGFTHSGRPDGAAIRDNA